MAKVGAQALALEKKKIKEKKNEIYEELVTNWATLSKTG
jgi:hypothetical protein